ncbi:MAG TPA: malto-oligosyltrehalose synthase [Methylomirabilota bacterium]|nr:malto-oligosyltrehalose synthase [Methylomirabilota bacterium]
MTGSKAIPQARIPTATYRLQFGEQFPFTAAMPLLGYLKELGITDLYASPIFQTPPGSAHGYNVCGFESANSSLGGDEGLLRLTNALKEEGLGLLVDMVPNHMAAHLTNCWWRDVLRFGRNSRYATFFDIDWNRHQGKVFLPTLGDHAWEAAQRRELQLAWHDSQLVVKYYDNSFPLSPESHILILREWLHLERKPIIAELMGKLAHSVRSLPEVDTALATLLSDSARGLEQALKSFNADPDRLMTVLDAQHYKLAFWRLAPEEINYRRFFDITDLVALTMERSEVFEETHRALFKWVHEGRITGLRIDHPDGLRAPRAYFRDLQLAALGDGPLVDRMSKLENSSQLPLYVVAEKILSADEQLPKDWRAHGTTGYDFLIALNGLFINSAAEPEFTRFYGEFTGCVADFHAIEHASKKEVLEMSFRGDINELSERLWQLAQKSPSTRGLSRHVLRTAIVELICSFSVYRTYGEPETGRSNAADAEVLNDALSAATKAKGIDSAALQYLGSVLRTETAPSHELLEFIWRFQQVSGPLTAKGVEDTAFYRYFRFISLNEVGGNPGRFGTTLDHFHAHCAAKARSWPHSMLASSTHDTKRGEDTRARLNVLSEMPERWQRFVNRSSALTARDCDIVSGKPAPDANDEYLFYQTAVAASGFEDNWPALATRVREYMLKAAREGKRNTSWIDQNTDYEKALSQYVERNLASDSAFVQELLKLRGEIEFPGVVNSLAQTLIKITAPGVPDFYQGSELWDFSLVDPDNRRPVDFTLRQEMLSNLRSRSTKDARSKFLASLLTNYRSPEIKLFLIHQALRTRNGLAELYRTGEYIPLQVEGDRARHLVAFARRLNKETAITVAPRFTSLLLNGAKSWETAANALQGATIKLPSEMSGLFEDAFSGEVIEGDALPAERVLARFPVALLVARQA